MSKAEDLNNVCVYFNNLLIGEAKTFKFKKRRNNLMPVLEIDGKSYIEK